MFLVDDGDIKIGRITHCKSGKIELPAAGYRHRHHVTVASEIEGPNGISLGVDPVGVGILRQNRRCQF